MIINWSMVALVITWTFAFTITSMAACGKHIQYLWGSYDVFAASCINTYAYTVYMGVTDFVIDILILTQPLPWVSSRRDAPKMFVFSCLISRSLGLATEINS